jgi:hypothetical protein
VLSELGAEVPKGDICIDGSPWENSPEAIEKWRRWFDSQEALFSGKELTRFEADLRASRDSKMRSFPHGTKGLPISASEPLSPG